MIDTQTDRQTHTHTQTQATTIPEGQNWPRVIKLGINHIHFTWYIAFHFERWIIRCEFRQNFMCTCHQRQHIYHGARFNSPRPSDVYMRQSIKPPLPPFGPSHYPDQCWNIVNWTIGNKCQWNINWSSSIFMNKICVWICRLQNGGHSASPDSMCWLKLDN